MKQIWIRIWPLALTSCVNLGVCACLFAQPCPPFCDPMDGGLPGSSLHGDSPGKNTGVGCHALLQEVFPTQGLNPGFRIAGRFFTSKSPGKPWWAAYPFSRLSSQSRNRIWISGIAGRFFTSWATRETLLTNRLWQIGRCHSYDHIYLK